MNHKMLIEIPQKAEKSAGQPAQGVCCQHNPEDDITISKCCYKFRKKFGWKSFGQRTGSLKTISSFKQIFFLS
jgi:hypothetical protein